jgi:hypothetical protein
MGEHTTLTCRKVKQGHVWEASSGIGSLHITISSEEKYYAFPLEEEIEG